MKEPIGVWTFCSNVENRIRLKAYLQYADIRSSRVNLLTWEGLHYLSIPLSFWSKYYASKLQFGSIRRPLHLKLSRRPVRLRETVLLTQRSLGNGEKVDWSHSQGRCAVKNKNQQWEVNFNTDIILAFPFKSFFVVLSFFFLQKDRK